MDLFPTLAELAGLEHKTEILLDGQRLVPFCKNPEKLEDRTLLWHYPHYHGSTWTPGSAIRSNQWKLVEFYEDQSLELFDLSKDLSEEHNLVEKHPGLADSLQHLMHQGLKEMGASYPKRKMPIAHHLP